MCITLGSMAVGRGHIIRYTYWIEWNPTDLTEEKFNIDEIALQC